MEYTWRCIFDEKWIASDLSGPSPEDFAWSKVDDDWTSLVGNSRGFKTMQGTHT